MNRISIGLAALLLVVVVACATAGKQFDRTHVNDVANGVQTKETIKAWFGDPYQVTFHLQGNPAGCVERWLYVHAYASHGGMKAQSASLVVDFDKQGKVCDHAYSETKK